MNARLIWIFLLISMSGPAFGFSLPERVRLQMETKTVVVANGEEVTLDSGRLHLPENRLKDSGRFISIPFYRLTTEAADPGPPIFILAGGPGSSGIRQFSGVDAYQAIQFYRRFSDVVVFDQRGTGGSQPNLKCPGARMGIPLDQPATAEAIGRVFNQMALECQAHWVSQGVDLKAYNTRENAADVNDLRKALGYDKIILIGGSYGSHLGLHLLRAYGAHIDRAIFYGIEGTDHTYDQPSHVVAALGRVAAFVEQSGVYADRIPENGLMGALEAAIARVRDQPVQHEMERGGETYRVWITSAVVQLIATMKAGSRDNPEFWPELVLAMYEGDYSMAARAASSLRGMGRPNAMKYMMDHASGLTPERREKIRRDPASSVLGMLDLDLFATQETWAAEDLGNNFRAPVVSDVPVLMVHGTWDTSTPIENAWAVAASLNNAHLIEVEGGNHGGLFNLFAHWGPAWETVEGFLRNDDTPLSTRVILDKPVFPKEVAYTGDAQAKLWEASRTGNLSALREALTAGADVNALDTRKSRTGRRPLNWAASRGHTDIIRELLRYGADINRTNLTGFTPLHHAVENNRIEAVTVLLASGADVHKVNKKGVLPSQTAEQLGHTKVLQLLRQTKQ